MLWLREKQCVLGCGSSFSPNEKAPPSGYANRLRATFFLLYFLRTCAPDRGDGLRFWFSRGFWKTPSWDPILLNPRHPLVYSFCVEKLNPPPIHQDKGSSHPLPSFQGHIFSVRVFFASCCCGDTAPTPPGPFTQPWGHTILDGPTDLPHLTFLDVLPEGDGLVFRGEVQLFFLLFDSDKFGFRCVLVWIFLFPNNLGSVHSVFN